MHNHGIVLTNGVSPADTSHTPATDDHGAAQEGPAGSDDAAEPPPPQTPDPTTATAIAAVVRDGALRPEQILDTTLARIRSGDRRVGAFHLIREDQARAEAAAVAERSDLDMLPLAGVPIAIKNHIDVVGEVTRAGSAAGDQRPAASAHPVVRRLREAGAVVVGLTETPEFGLWGVTDTPERITRSPWNPRYSAGGSSGGSAG